MGLMKRREFLLGGLAVHSAAKPQNEVDVSVMEVYSSSSGPAALLVHHADEATRETFAAWLRTNTGKAITCKLRDKPQTAARIFRVSLCFGRGLILLRTPAPGVRARDVLRLALE